MLSLFCVYAWFLSDLLFPELWFAIATLTFLQTVRRRDRASHTVVAYFAAVAAYALRSIGIVVSVTWVIDSVLHRRLRTAAVRAVLALLPVATWQMYVAGVERSPAYNAPAYAYQRAPYNFYNVSYAKTWHCATRSHPRRGALGSSAALSVTRCTSPSIWVRHSPPRHATSRCSSSGYREGTGCDHRRILDGVPRHVDVRRHARVRGDGAAAASWRDTAALIRATCTSRRCA